MTLYRSVLVKGALVVDPSMGNQKVADLRLQEGTIVDSGPDLIPEPAEHILDAAGLMVCPGFIDLHTHLRDLAQKDKEDFESGTRAAAAGGFTTVVAMANTDPPVDNAMVLSTVLSRIDEQAVVEVLPVACVTRGMQGKELTNMAELGELGAIAFSDDGMPVSDLSVLRRAMEYAQMTGRIIISHAEDHDLSRGGVMHEGLTATRLGLPGIPFAAESAAVAREIEVVRQTGTRYHFTHISCAASVKLIARARADGLPITADATPHHLTLTTDDIPGYDPCYKMNPPLRTADDAAALAAALKDGTIDAIATDHAPHTRLEKSGTMVEAPAGITGLETAFSLTYERLVTSGFMEAPQFISLLTTGPARILDLPQPSLRPGSPATVTIIDPALEWTYDAGAGQSRSNNSPYHGRRLRGKVAITFFRGKAVYTDEPTIARRLRRQ